MKRVNLVGNVKEKESEEEDLFIGLAAIERNKDRDEETDDVTTDVCISGEARWTQTVDINGHIVNLKLDTGAGANILNVRDYKALKRKPGMKETKMRLIDFNGKAIVVQGQCILSVTTGARTYHVLFVVVETGPSLLGRTACCLLYTSPSPRDS